MAATLNPRSQLAQAIAATYAPPLKPAPQIPENPQFARSLGGYVLPRCEAQPVVPYDMPDWRECCQLDALLSTTILFNDPAYEGEEEYLLLYCWQDRSNYVLN